MSEEEPVEPQPDPPPRGTTEEQIQLSPVSARILPQVGRGVLSTGVIVIEGPHEFVLDFALVLGAPHSIVARIVMTHGGFAQFMAALGENLRMYESRFGKPPALPAPMPNQPQPTLTEVYEHLKLPDEMLAGVYANAVMIGHTPAEFWFDFITNFYPRSAVCSRVFLAAQHIPSLLERMTLSWEAHQRKHGKGPEGSS
jgi:uncharacterized protein DUF3467